MAHPLLEALLRLPPAHLARTVGAERMAELCDYGVAPGGDSVDSVEIPDFSSRAGLRTRKSGVHADAATKILIEGR